MNTSKFIHLRVHSDYSIIDGLNKVNNIVKKASLLHMPAIAITDFTNLFGLIKFYKSAYLSGIKPIIGADFLLHNDDINYGFTELTILAANNTGYQNLILMISEAYKQGYSNLGPMINRSCLVKYNKGVILLSGAKKGDIGKYLINGNKLKLKECINFYKINFPNRYYIELVRTGRPNEETYLKAAVKLAINQDLPIVATNDVRFNNVDDFEAHEVRVAIHNSWTLYDTKRPYNYSPQQYMRSNEEMYELFKDLPEALSNSVEIARRCNVNLSLGKHFLPNFPTGNISSNDYLIKSSYQGLEKKLIYLFPDINKRKIKKEMYETRLNNELKIINKMKFSGYFLIVMEFIQWAKNNNIPVGPGRGSGAGSLVAYVLNITDVDPLKFGLLFERFLNLERISMPDFDIDFCMDKRDLVIDHVNNIYGSDKVSQIITFGTMTARAVIRDVGRALNYPYSFINRISKLVPSDLGITLQKAFSSELKLKSLYDTDEEVKVLINMAKKLEGVIRNASKHSGGVVISPTKITDFVPLYCDSSGKNRVTQFDKNDIEYIGLVKFDFLGLRTLTIINSSLQMINKKRFIKKLHNINITDIKLDDKKCFDMLKHSQTTGLFQLESHGMKDLVKRLKPDCFEDIIALIALFRPGPLKSGMVENFINRKHGKEKIYYPDSIWQHISLKPILKSTYGIILYQEQVMQIAQILANYSLSKADILRRVMGKKQIKEMEKQRLIFKLGSKKNGINETLSMKIFDLIEKFAGYGFNKSHSTAYALISYQTLWLKSHYPSEFMAAIINSDIDNNEKILGLVNECIRMGLKILPPNINYSIYNFYVNENNEIIYGLGAIKGIGINHIEEIVKEREKNGNFYQLFDFCMRINIKKITRRILEKLIMSGACDTLGRHRAELINNTDNAIRAAEQYYASKAIGQRDMFGMLKKTKFLIKDIYKTNKLPFSNKEILDGERETLGFYLTSNPIMQYIDEILHYTKGIRLKDINVIKNKHITTVAGFVLSARISLTKKGDRIGICTLDDCSGRLDIIIFAETLKKYKYLIKKDTILIVFGKITIDQFNGKFKMIVYRLMDIMEAREKYVRNITIIFMDKTIYEEKINRLIILLKKHKYGKTPIYIYCKKQNLSFKLNFMEHSEVMITDSLLNDLRMLVGSDKVLLDF